MLIYCHYILGTERERELKGATKLKTFELYVDDSEDDMKDDMNSISVTCAHMDVQRCRLTCLFCTSVCVYMILCHRLPLPL